MPVGTVQAKLTLDSAQFEQGLDRATKKIQGTAREQEAASRRIAVAWEKELVLQDRAAQQAEQVGRAKELAALKSDILARSIISEQEAAARSEATFARLITSLGNNAGASLRAEAANRRLAASQEMVATSGAHQVSSMAASSGALRLLEGNFTNNLRAAERFAGTTLGLGPILEAAFPVVGAIALGGALVEMGGKAYEAEENIFHLKDAITGLNEMDITIGKRLGSAADSIEQQVESILEKTEGKPVSVQQKYSYEGAKPLDLTDYFYDDKFKKLPEDLKANYESMYKIVAPQDAVDRLSRIRHEMGLLTDAAAMAKGNNFGMVVSNVGGFGPNSDRDPADYWTARLKIAQQIEAQLQSATDARGTRMQGLQMDYGDAQKQQREDDARKAEEAQRKGEEARRKASGAQWSGFEGQVSALKNDHDVSAAEEYLFWRKLAAASATYPENVRKITEKTGQLYQEMGHQIEEVLRKSDTFNREAARKAAEITKEWDAEANKLADLMDRMAERGILAGAKLLEMNQANVTATRELVTAHNLVTGAISKRDAAQQVAAEHAEMYMAQMQQIATDRAAALGKDDQEYLPGEKQAIGAEYDAKQAGVQGEADRTAMQDKWLVAQETAAGGFKSAIDQVIEASKDYASQMKSLTDGVLGDVNKTLLEELTTRHRHGPRHLWTNVGHDLAAKATGMGITDLEGTIFGGAQRGGGAVAAMLAKLGFGGKVGSAAGGMGSKAAHALGFGGGKGTRSDPVFVKIVENVQAASARLSSLAAPSAAVLAAGNAAASAMGTPASSVVAKMLKLAVPFAGILPGFADGVNNFGGGWAMVGERGPEILQMPRGSNVVPNHKLGDYMGGGDVHHTWNIDARGATDPAQVNAQIHQAMSTYLPHIVKASQSYSADQRRRSITKS